MKTAIFLVLLLITTPTMAAEPTGKRVHFDSAWLDSEEVLSSEIKKAKAPEGGGVPIGTVIAWPLHDDPDEGTWLECNGQAIPEEYQLHDKMTHTPNYSGMFLRGTGGNAAALGEEQGDAIRNMTGLVAGYAGTSGANGAFYSSAFRWYAGCHAGGWTWYNTYFNAARQVPTADEIRPINKAVRYLIRAD